MNLTPHTNLDELPADDLERLLGMEMQHRSTKNAADELDVIHVVSFSGGHTSGYLVHLLEQKRINDGWRVEYVFMDTGFEAPETYQFVKDIINHWGVKVHCIRTVVNPVMGVGVTYREIGIDELKPDLKPWIDMIAKYGAPTINSPYCTSRMKTEPHKKYLEEKWGLENTVTWLGIRNDEPHRLRHFMKTIDMFNPTPQREKIRYLAELSFITKDQVDTWWGSQPFKLELPRYAGNCILCIKKGLEGLTLAARRYPELAQAFRDALMSDKVRIKDTDKYGQGVIYRNTISIDTVLKTAKALGEVRDDEEGLYAASIDDGDNMCSQGCEVDFNRKENPEAPVSLSTPKKVKQKKDTRTADMFA